MSIPRKATEKCFNFVEKCALEVCTGAPTGRQTDDTRIEDRMIALQRRLDQGITAGRLTRGQGREFQFRLDAIRRDFLQQIRDRPFTPEEKTDISSHLDSLEGDINQVW